MTRHLVIMLKEPVSGRVKMRLGCGIGMTTAAWWFRHQVARLLREVGRDRRWTTWLAVTPDRAETSPIWPAPMRRWPQGRGNLGDRMGRIFRNFPPGKVVVIAADVPDVRASFIADAFSALGVCDAVVGPSGDGGYWLIGLRRGSQPLPQRLFAGVRWSTEHALADTLRTFGTFQTARIAALDDVDIAEDLARLSKRAHRSMAGARSLR